MQTLIKLMLFVFVMLGIVSCTPKMTRDFWNGVYSDRAAVEKRNQAELEYYSQDTLIQKKQREKNRESCLKLSGGLDGSEKKWDERLYFKCLEDKGTPEFR